MLHDNPNPGGHTEIFRIVLFKSGLVILNGRRSSHHDVADTGFEGP